MNDLINSNRNNVQKEKAKNKNILWQDKWEYESLEMRVQNTNGCKMEDKHINTKESTLIFVLQGKSTLVKEE